MNSEIGQVATLAPVSRAPSEATAATTESLSVMFSCMALWAGHDPLWRGEDKGGAVAGLEQSLQVEFCAARRCARQHYLCVWGLWCWVFMKRVSSQRNCERPWDELPRLEEVSILESSLNAPIATEVGSLRCCELNLCIVCFHVNNPQVGRRTEHMKESYRTEQISQLLASSGDPFFLRTF